MTSWTYFSAFFASGGHAERPHTLLRLRAAHPISSAERLDRSGAWLPSAILLDIARGRDELETQEITTEQAAAFSHAWHAQGLIPQVPEDLAS